MDCFMFQIQKVTQWVSELVTRSPIELFWTAKKRRVFTARLPRGWRIVQTLPKGGRYILRGCQEVGGSVAGIIQLSTWTWTWTWTWRITWQHPAENVLPLPDPTSSSFYLVWNYYTCFCKKDTLGMIFDKLWGSVMKGFTKRYQNSDALQVQPF